jgi:flavin-dependent dehydrogenase
MPFAAHWTMSVIGVQCETITGGLELILADIVIDASKDGALTFSFLKSAGLAVPEETTIGVDIRYATALFALPDGILGDFKEIVTFPRVPENALYGCLVPVENGRHEALLIGRGDDAPPIDCDAFVAYAQRLRTPTINNAIKHAKRLSDVAHYTFPENKWRHFGKLRSSPRGLTDLLPIGDMICCLNPIHGQGITVAVKEANILDRLLRKRLERRIRLRRWLTHI